MNSFFKVDETIENYKKKLKTFFNEEKTETKGACV